MAEPTASSKPLTPRDRLIFALDVNNRHEAEEYAKKLVGHVGMFKVGLELYSSEGPAMVNALIRMGAPVFLDLKLHDIPTTVERSAVVASKMGVTFLTVHATGGPRMLQAACRGAREGAGTGKSATKILAVTILTSMEMQDLDAVGLAGPVPAAVTRLATIADQASCYGVVASAREATAVRKATKNTFAIVTPGIRLAGAEMDDQARAETPLAAIDAGADFLVVGRPIRDAENPVAVADAIVADIDRGLVARDARGGLPDEEPEFTPIDPPGMGGLSKKRRR